MMRAITLWRPWPWTFVHATSPKRIENRPRPLPKTIVGEIVALHAGAAWDAERLPLIRELEPAIPTKETAHPMFGVFAVCVFTENLKSSDDRWWLGPNAWKIGDGDFISFDMVPCRGKQGIWTLEPDVEREVVRRAWAAVKETAT